MSRNRYLVFLIALAALVLILLVWCSPLTGQEDLEIEIDNGSTTNTAAPAEAATNGGEENGSKAEAGPKGWTGEISVTPLPEKTAWQYQFYGRIFYRMMMNQIKSTNTGEYDKFHVEKVRGDIGLGFMFFNARDMEARVEFNLNTDNSFYDFKLFNVYILYDQPAYNLGLFYKERVLDLDDALRLLDPEYLGYYRPVFFYRQPLNKEAYFGQDHYGLFLNYNGIFRNQLNVSVPVDGSGTDKLFVIDKVSKEFSLFSVSGNFIFINQDFRLPDVNGYNWAELNGTWYEFNTNTFYDPPEMDYKLKATVEAGVNLMDRLLLFGEAGVDNKYGGYYGETTQKAASSGNIPYFMALSSPSYRYLVTGGGLQFKLGNILLESTYSYYQGKYDCYSYFTNLYRIRQEPVFNTVKVKARIDLDIFYTETEAGFKKVTRDRLTEYFDEYNFNRSLSLSGVDSVRSIRSFNQLRLGPVTLYPEVEYRSYNTPYTNSFWLADLKTKFETLEINSGLGYPVASRLNLYFNTRWKRYYAASSGMWQGAPYEWKRDRSVLSWFLNLTYTFTENINFSLMYGLDPRLNIPYEYGFEYVLGDVLREGSGDWNGLDSVLAAEERIAKNNYIVVAGMIKF
ncbi:MAG: hypothetical protein PHF84_04840 [bacterium]|nr:hypothetical protein [bacterium]